MIAPLARTATAELVKLSGLPAAAATALVTVVAGAIFTAVLVRADLTATAALTRAVPFLQVGPILLGILAAATEYAGRQIATTLTVTPHRLLLLAGKAVAYLIAAIATSVTTIGAGLVTARLVRPASGMEVWPQVGAAAYLTLIGLLSLGSATLLRSLAPPLTSMLVLVLIVSPVLSGHAEQARWLPDRAGSLLYAPNSDTMLGPVTGAAVLVLWIGVTMAAATITFLRRDA